MTIHTIDLDFQGVPRVIAAFLIEGPEGLILIETGPGSTLDHLTGGIESLGFALDDVRDVFVTHIHLDHAGAAGWWGNRGATVYVHPKGARHLVDPSRLMDSARMIYQDRMDALWGDMVPAPEENVRTLEDNETVEAGGVSITALDTPGHARHHLCYAIGDAVFAGDVAGMRLPDCAFISVTSAPPQFEPDPYDNSIARLEGGDYERLFLTHFGEFTDVAEHLAAYRENVRQATAFVRDRLEEGMDAESLQVAYEAYQMEIAFRAGIPQETWSSYQLANPPGMCADGIRLYWEKASGS